MKRIVFLLCGLAVLCLSLPHSAQMQNRRRAKANSLDTDQPAAVERLLKTAARQLQNKNFLQAYQTAKQALTLSQESHDKARQARCGLPRCKVDDSSPAGLYYQNVDGGPVPASSSGYKANIGAMLWF